MDAAENLCHYFKKLRTLSGEYRHAHELGDVGFSRTDEPEAQQNPLAPADSDGVQPDRVLHSCADERKRDSPDTSEKWVECGSSHFPLSNSSLCEAMDGRNQEKIGDAEREASKARGVPTRRILFKETVVTSAPLRNHPNVEHCKNM